MKNYPKHIKSTLHSVIRDMAKHPEDFCYCPEKDFTRKRKLPFEKVLTLLVKMGGHSLRDEMLDSLAFKEVPASVSALVQQRSKILPEALEYLFHKFTDNCHKHVYQTNFTAAVHICRQFLRGDVAPPKVEALISSYVVPIRPGRYTPRRAKNIKFNGFFYRIA